MTKAEQRDTIHDSDNGNGRRQTFFYIATSLVVLTATVIALVSLSEAHTGQTVCSYIRQSYPASHAYRVQVKGFVYDHYLHLKQEATAYRESAADEPDTVAAQLDRRLATLTDLHARTALHDWRELKLPGPPTCS